MPPRSPALRRRTAPYRAAHASNVGIWITDAMLIQAVETYQRAASGKTRPFNSYAGPLESRRRASRRHMTDLMPASHTFPPIWQFDVGTRRLQWEAPTSQEKRRRKRDQQFSVSGIINTFIGWLDKQGLTARRLHAMAASLSDTGSSVVRSEALAVDSCPAGYVETAEKEAQEPNTRPTLPEEIALLRSSIPDMHARAINDDAHFFDELYQAAKVCKRCLRRRIERGDLSVQGLIAALEPLDATSRSLIPTAEMANRISAMIRRAILYAMADVHNQNPAAVAPELWPAFVDNLCAASKGDAHDVQLLRRLLETMPASLKHDLSVEQMRNMTRRLVTAQAHRHNLFPHWLLLASRFSQALQQLPAQRQHDLDVDMAAFLSQQDQLSEDAKRMRFAWLVIKAHTARTGTQGFINLYRNCLGPGHRLNGLQRWQVIFARLSGLQMLDPASRKQLLHAEYTSQYERWSSLLTHAMSSADKDAALQQLSAVLVGIGEFPSTVRVLTFPPVHELDRNAMEALATACSSHNEALALYDAIDSKPHADRVQPLWSWTTWTKHTEAIIKDPAIDPSRIWQLLKLTYTSRAMSSDPALLAAENTAKSNLLVKMTSWYIQAHHLSDRQVLRNLQRCLNAHRALNNATVPHQMLVSLVELISRDLDRGQRGRTSRMEWLLRMVSDAYGAEQARKAASAWRGWRWTIQNAKGPSLRMYD